MKKKVTFAGGFHNSKALNLVIDFNEALYNSYSDGEINEYELIENSASENQLKRLEKHFCGIKGCTCYSWYRHLVTIDIN